MNTRKSFIIEEINKTGISDNLDGVKENENKYEYQEIEQGYRQVIQKKNCEKLFGNNDMETDLKQYILCNENGETRIVENEYFYDCDGIELAEDCFGFENNNYAVVELKQPIVLYRAQSFDSPGGSYFVLDKPKDKLETKMSSALSNIWADRGNIQNYNTREYIETVEFKTGMKFYVGKIAGQETIGSKKTYGQNGKYDYPLIGGNIQFIPVDKNWTDIVGTNSIKIEKFNNSSRYKEFSKMIDEKYKY